MMTRDEILNMPAGRELDVLVANKVLGIVPTKWHPLENPWDEIPLRPYSTDIAAAWKVVERLHEKGFYTGFYRNGKGATDKRGNFIENWGVDIGCVIELADQPTLPLAICRAALLAVLEVE